MYPHASPSRLLRLFPGDSSFYQANHTHSQQTAAPFPIVKATLWILSPSSIENCTTGRYTRESPVTSLRALGTAGHVWHRWPFAVPATFSILKWGSWVPFHPFLWAQLLGLRKRCGHQGGGPDCAETPPSSDRPAHRSSNQESTRL